MSDKKINDGGPAFPRPAGHSGTPGRQNNEQDGMTLRDWFAGMVLQGLCAHQTFPLAEVSTDAYEIADAMLVAREVTNE